MFSILSQRIFHAQQICKNYEDTVECKLAWEHVEELSKAAARKKKNPPKKKDIQCEVDPLACREYDI